MKYKGYWLHPAPTRASAGSGWLVEIVIERPGVDDAEDFVFRLADRFATRKEAEDASLALGRQIVDGEHPEFRIG